MWNHLFSFYFAIILILSAVMMILGRLISLKIPYLGKMAPYECGFDPMNSPRLPFSFRFFLVAILFLMFDLEIALLLVLPFSLSISCPTISAWFLTAFLFMLIVGLYYEWVKGGLDWAKD